MAKAPPTPFPLRLLANRSRKKVTIATLGQFLGRGKPFNIIYLVQVRYYPATKNGQEIIPTEQVSVPKV